MKRMPALFIGHGSPMLALDHNEMTKTLTELGKRIITDYGRPKAIAVVSAHWYSRGSYVNAAQKPEQIYDMYGFPQALYEVSYPALGDPQTARRIHDLTGAVMTEDWGIDHGVWTLFVHMFPDASLPVVPLSVDGTLSPHDQYAFGEKLAALREEGIVVAGSGNIVHNLMQTDWNNPHGSKEADEFDAFITEKVQERDDVHLSTKIGHKTKKIRHKKRIDVQDSSTFLTSFKLVRQTMPSIMQTRSADGRVTFPILLRRQVA